MSDLLGVGGVQIVALVFQPHWLTCGKKTLDNNALATKLTPLPSTAFQPVIFSTRRQNMKQPYHPHYFLFLRMLLARLAVIKWRPKIETLPLFLSLLALTFCSTKKKPGCLKHGWSQTAVDLIKGPTASRTDGKDST